MAYQTGTASSSFDLFNKLDTFIQALSGWQLWADIAEYDKVYFSSGEDGYNDIYIRMKAAADEPFIYGLDQKPLTPDGDTGFVNFFAYNYYPQGGDGYSGYGEIGILGPRFYHFALNRVSSISGTTIEPTVSRVAHINMLSQKPGGGFKGVGESTAVPGGGNSGYGYSPTTLERKRWTNISRFGEGDFNSAGGNNVVGFDGRRYFYVSTTSFVGVKRYSISRFGGGKEGIAAQGQGIGILHKDFDDINAVISAAQSAYVVTLDPQTRHEILYYMDFDSEWNSVDLDTGTISSLTNPSYVASTTTATMLAWDGNDKIYHIRGDSTTEWAIYSISANLWTNAGVALPANASYADNSQLVFVPHYISGAVNNRLYHVSDDDLYYINLDNNTGFRLGGTAVWTSAGTILGGLVNADDPGVRIWVNRHGRMFAHSGRGRDYVYDKSTDSSVTQISDGRPLLYTDSIVSPNWKIADMLWLPNHTTTISIDDKVYGWYMDAYQSRVRTAIGSSTEYHVVGDEDRVIVGTISDGISSLCYAGGFEPDSDDNTIATLDNDLSPGYSQQVRVSSVRGQFVEGSRYFIMDTTAGKGFVETHPIEGIKRNLINSESVIITSVAMDGDGYFLTFSNRLAYAAGAKIGIDPQPVGLLMGGLQKFQTTNNVPEQYDDFSGTDDRGSQVYSMCTNDEIVRSGSSQRTAFKMMWPANFGTFEGEGFYEGKELRGSMKDVLVGPDFDSVSTVHIDGKAYMAFKLKNLTTSYFIGPLED